MVVRSGRSDGGDRAVSQVIGIVMLVGITVVLVGLTAVYMTGFSEETQEPAPRLAAETGFNTSLSGEGQYLNITHDGGEPIDTDRIYVKVSGARVDSGGEATYDGSVIADQAGDEFQATETISLNRTAFVDDTGSDLTGSDYLDLTDATVRIIWEIDRDDNDRTEIIYECEVGVPACAGD